MISTPALLTAFADSANRPLAQRQLASGTEFALGRREGPYIWNIEGTLRLLDCATAGGVPLYTDARHYAAAGVPIILYGAGPRSIEDANAHRADERVRPGDLHAATRIVALALADPLET